MSDIEIEEEMINSDNEKLFKCIESIQNDQILTSFIPYCTKNAQFIHINSIKTMNRFLEIYALNYGVENV